MKAARYDDQLFARCTKSDRRMAVRAARASNLALSDFIREAVREKTAETFPDMAESNSREAQSA